jgi:prolyl 4-hydroxylase
VCDDRAADVVNESVEPLQVLHYAVGEFFDRHVDFLRPSLPDYEQEMRCRGQRVKTCLVYLNDDYQAGETHFPHLGLKVRGGIGDALIFENLRVDGTGDMKTAHAGLPPSCGEKWLLSQWIRDKPQPVE